MAAGWLGAGWLPLALCWALAGAQNCRNDSQERARGCDAVCHEGVCEIRAALILSSNTSHIISLPRVRPVFELAERSIRERQLIPDEIKFNLTYYDDRCDAAFALISAIDAYTDQCTHVYFGPACEYALASVARITRFLGHTGTPLVTVGGLTFDFAMPKTTCDHEYFMLARAGLVGFRDIAYFIIEVMRSFHWAKLLLINEPEAQNEVAGPSTCHLMSKTFVNFLKKEKMLYTSWDTTSTGENRSYSSNLKFYMGFKYTNGAARNPGSHRRRNRDGYATHSQMALSTFRRFGWGRCALIYETAAYTEVTGQGGGFLLASTVHDYLLSEDIMVMGREIFIDQEDIYRNMLLQFVGNMFGSESTS